MPTHDAFADLTPALLVLSRVPGLNGHRLLELLEVLPNVNAILAADPQTLQNRGLGAATIRAIKSPDWRAIERDQVWLRGSQSRRLVVIGDVYYPKRLAQIADPPMSLFVDGDATVLSLPQLAIVGSRNPTLGGADDAFAFAAGLARFGLVVTSGLAIGIDSAAHCGALHAKGTTVAVLGNGIGSIYPQRNQLLAQRIIAGGGAIVTQYGTGTPPLGRNFPYRNRLISGLSHGVIVIEAAQRSGSLVTARHAAEQGRDVFALPGSIHNSKVRGCHALIRDGAILVESVDDVLEELAPQLRQMLACEAAPSPAASPTQAAKRTLTADEQQLLDILEYDQASLEALVQHSGLSTPNVAATLSNLELDGLVQKSASGHYMQKNQAISKPAAQPVAPKGKQITFDY